MKYILSILIIQFFTSMNTFASQYDIHWPDESEISKLTLLEKQQIIQQLQKLYYEFENENLKNFEVGHIKNNSPFLIAAFFENAFALSEKCIIGGKILPKTGNKCSTLGNSCEQGDRFLCGQIYGNACVERNPVQSISKRCSESENALKMKPEQLAGMLNSLRKNFEEYCLNQENDGCRLLGLKLTKIELFKKQHSATEVILPKNAPDCIAQNFSFILEGSSNKDNSLDHESHQLTSQLTDTLRLFSRGENNHSNIHFVTVSTQRNQLVTLPFDSKKQFIEQINKTKNFCSNQTLKSFIDLKQKQKKISMNLKNEFMQQNQGEIVADFDNGIENQFHMFLSQIDKQKNRCPNSPLSIQIATIAKVVGSDQNCKLQLANGKKLGAQEFLVV